MVPAQHRAGQIVEASMARLAQVALPVPLAFVMAIADDHGIVAVRAAHASWPTMLTHKLKTLGLVQQPREIDHLRYRHACAASKTTRSRLHPIRSETWLQRYPARATTPEPNKSLCRLTNGPASLPHRTLQTAPDFERVVSSVTVTDPRHPLFGQQLKLLSLSCGRGPAYIAAALPDGR